MDASHVYARAWALGCFHSLISTQTFRRAQTASVDSCAEIKSALQWRNKIWQSLEEGAGKRCSEWGGGGGGAGGGGGGAGGWGDGGVGGMGVGGWGVGINHMLTHRLVGSIVQELCESRGGRPGLSVLTSLLVSVDVKFY